MRWIQRRHDEAITRRKQEEVQQCVSKWTIDRSRDESELLRRRESMKLVAGLERTHRRDLYEHVRGGGENAPAHETRPPPPSDARAENSSADESLSDAVSAVKPKKPPLVEEYLRTGGTAPIVVLKQSVKKADMMKGGGMHFRNQLPANYTPPSRFSHQSSSSGSSTASWRDRSVATPSSVSTPSSFASEKKTHLLHAAGSRTRRDSTSSAGSSGFSDGNSEGSTDEERTGAGETDVAVENDVTPSPQGEQPTRRRMELEPYHIPYFETANADVKATGARSTHALSSLKVRNVDEWVGSAARSLSG